MDTIAERMFYTELGYPIHAPTVQFGDNDASNAFVKDPVLHGRMKHIDIAYHVVKDYQADGQIVMARVATDANVADSLTKPTGHPTYGRFCSAVIVFEELALPEDVNEDDVEA